MGKFDKKSKASLKGSKAALRENADMSFNPEYAEIARWLQKVRFRKKLLGGYDPADVWKKLDELNTLYERALISERARYNLMLEQMEDNEDPEGFYV